MKAYDVYDHDEERLIDQVFWVDNSDADEVRRSLINHDGYHPGIIVVRTDDNGNEVERAE